MMIYTTTRVIWRDNRLNCAYLDSSLETSIPLLLPDLDIVKVEAVIWSSTRNPIRHIAFLPQASPQRFLSQHDAGCGTKDPWMLRIYQELAFGRSAWRKNVQTSELDALFGRSRPLSKNKFTGSGGPGSPWIAQRQKANLYLVALRIVGTSEAQQFSIVRIWLLSYNSNHSLVSKKNQQNATLNAFLCNTIYIRAN